jgi:hypothetical protein
VQVLTPMRSNEAAKRGSADLLCHALRLEEVLFRAPKSAAIRSINHPPFADTVASTGRVGG